MLTREYARRLIELAAFYDRKLLTSHELTRVRPPYSDSGRICWPEVVAEKREIPAKDSPFRRDFENYTLGRLVADRAPYDFKHPGYLRVRAQVLWRVGELGWTAERFGKIDDHVERQSYSRVMDEPGKVDRYGKKYSLIAFFEIRGLLEDQGLLKEDAWCERTSEVDIDPSFPVPRPEYNLVSTSFLGRPGLTLAEWISDGPTPNLRPHLRQQAILGESGPWVMLDGFISQQDESRGRRIFAFIRSFLLANKDAPAFTRCLIKQSLGERWLPEKPRTIYTFAGETPWCATFPSTGATRFQFKIRERRVKVKRKLQSFYLDGKEVTLSYPDLVRLQAHLTSAKPTISNSALTDEQLVRVEIRGRIVEVEEPRSEIRRFRAIIPVIDFGWEGRNIDGQHATGTSLAKTLALSAGLAHFPQTHDLQVNRGARATYGIVARPHDYNNSQRFFFIRREILDSLLRKHGFSLVWVVWGERELSSAQLDRVEAGGDLAGNSYASFQRVHSY